MSSQALNREDVVEMLRPETASHLAHLEDLTALDVSFRALPNSFPVVAQYSFDGRTPTILIRSDWKDCDIHHELMHMEMELLDGYHVLAWKPNVSRSKDVERASGWLRDYVDDEVVFARLLQQGYELDGEVLKPQFFDDRCTKAANRLNKLKPRSEDSMSDLDDIGYGNLCRSSLLVRAVHILETYGNQLNHDRLKRLTRFVIAFRRHRGEEAERADQILNMFQNHNLYSVEGHRDILVDWSCFENLDEHVGASAYINQNGGHTLPFPEPRRTRGAI